MLYLTRRPGEAIVIGKHVRLVVQWIRGRKVTIGIEAPLDVDVDREEVYLRKRKERKLAR
jgi:carbon storage regulator